MTKARKSSGLSQQAVASKLGRPQSFVSKYESGERRIDVVEFLMLAEVIGFDAIDIIKLLSARTGQRARRRQRPGSGSA